MDVKSIVSALSAKVATECFSVTLPSSGISLDFMPISVGQQKSFSKLLMNNSQNSAVVYNSMLALIVKTCLSKDRLDFKKATELDRMKIVITFCAKNYSFNDVKIPCPKCKKDMTVKLDLAAISKLIDEFGEHSCDFVYTTEKNRYSFVLGIPSIHVMAQLEQWMNDHKESGEKPSDGAEKEDSPKMQHLERLFSSEDTMKAFIKKFEVCDIIDPSKPIIANMEGLPLKDIIELCNILPSEIFNTSTGLIQLIISKFLKPLLTLGHDITCEHCQNVIEKGFSLQIFFI